MQEVSRFIVRGQDNTDYVLFCTFFPRFKSDVLERDSGHSGQHPELDSDEVDEPEEDGNSECERPKFL